MLLLSSPVPQGRGWEVGPQDWILILILVPTQERAGEEAGSVLSSWEPDVGPGPSPPRGAPAPRTDCTCIHTPRFQKKLQNSKIE